MFSQVKGFGASENRITFRQGNAHNGAIVSTASAALANPNNPKSELPGLDRMAWIATTSRANPAIQADHACQIQLIEACGPKPVGFQSPGSNGWTKDFQIGEKQTTYREGDYSVRNKF